MPCQYKTIKYSLFNKIKTEHFYYFNKRCLHYQPHCSYVIFLNEIGLLRSTVELKFYEEFKCFME